MTADSAPSCKRVMARFIFRARIKCGWCRDYHTVFFNPQAHSEEEIFCENRPGQVLATIEKRFA